MGRFAKCAGYAYGPVALGLCTAAAVATFTGLGANAKAAANAAGPRPARQVLLDCQGRPEVRPARFTLACADGNSYLAGLTWTSWSPGQAQATGIQEVNDCVPYCAAGHFRGYPVQVSVRGDVPVSGGQRYSTVALTYTGARPQVPAGGHLAEVPRTITSPLQPPGIQQPPASKPAASRPAASRPAAI